MALNVGDRIKSVMKNRKQLCEQLELKSEPQWLTQVHGCDVAVLEGAPRDIVADGVVCFNSDCICTLLTADCLPVFFCDRQGTRVGLAHAGWRGLNSGILSAVVEALDCEPCHLMSWLGPAIGPRAFRVGEEVRTLFAKEDALAFLPDGMGKWMANIYVLARQQLMRLGVNFIGGGSYCTYYDSRFYSYRRDAVTGRMANVIWLT